MTITITITITTIQQQIRQGLLHAQGYYNDDDRSTNEGMYRIKPG